MEQEDRKKFAANLAHRIAARSIFAKLEKV